MDENTEIGLEPEPLMWDSGLLPEPELLLEHELPLEPEPELPLEPQSIPPVFNDLIDTTNMTNVLLIDSTLADKQIFYESANANTFPIIYDSTSKTDDLLALLRQKFTASSIQRISLVFHDRGPNVQAPFMNNSILFQDSDLEVGQTNFSENLSFLVSCLNEFHVSHIDFLACNTLQYSNWKSYYALLSSQTSVVVGASNDATGNMQYGGDWIMESTSEDVMDIYFNANISNYVSLLASTISQSGGTILLQMNPANGLYVQYSSNGGSSWTDISGTSGANSWPVTFTNSTPAAGTILTIKLVTDISMSTTYTAGTSGYFIAGSQYVTFDGSSNYVRVNSVTSYPGFIQNGTSVANGQANIVVQNFTTAMTTSTLAANAGWLCQSYFGRGVTGNSITGCTNTAAVNASDAGGIVGFVAGRSGSLTITNCANSGAIVSTNAGGITGSSAANSAGSITITSCTNTGTISGSSAGGIVGSGAGNTLGLVTIINCYNTSTISVSNAGGIAGSRFAYTTSTNCVIRGCYSTGGISGSNAGGIVGADVGYSTNVLYTAIVDISNCYSLGTISATGGGICGGTAPPTPASSTIPSITISNCYSSGTIVTANSGIVSTSYPYSTTQTNVYAAQGVWNITNANANLTGTPTNFNTPGSTWTMVDSQYPYVLSLYNAALYTSSSVSGITTYTSAGSVFGSTGYTYIIININQVANVATTKVFAYKGTAPNYYSYNYNTFTLTDTNGDSVPGKMSSSIASTTGVLTITKSANNISADGSGNSIYLQMSGASMQYSVGSTPGSWTTISTWPMTLTNSNSNPGPSSVLRVVATQALSISSSTGTATTGYFIAGSPYITFDGSGNTITINTLTSYVGLIQNGETTAGSNGFANVVVQNFTTAVSGGSTLASSAGWLCQQYFGRNVLGNAITGCTNSSTGLISASSSGGIAGQYAGSFGGSLTFTGCTNAGTISGQYAGGIAGQSAGSTSGSVTFTGCTNTATISGISAGGIAGSSAGITNGLVTITNCFSSGAISGSNSGGITGYYFANNTSRNCVISGSYSTGAISGSNAGGIVGASVGFSNNALYTGSVDISNCYSLGNISATCGGICGGYAGTAYTKVAAIRISNCYSYGALTGTGAGLVGVALTSTTYINLTATNTYVAGFVGGTNWADASANANLTGTPTNINTSNPGSTWASVGNNLPYVLSLYNAALYSPDTATASSPYTSAASVFGSTSGYTYKLVNTSQVGAVATTRVLVSKGTGPYYYSYNFNTFTFTNSAGSTTLLSNINTLNGTLYYDIGQSPLAISADGATQSVYLRMSGSIIQYSTDNQVNWNNITFTNWPVMITNSNPSPGSTNVLRVAATQALTISSTYGNTSGYFIAGSSYITFDGSGNTINMNTITNYPGFIQNGTSSANGFANVVVQNFTTAISGSTLATYAGWVCQSYFGKGVLGNQITGCTNTGAVNAFYAGGIVGSYAGSSSGLLNITNCSNTGAASSTYTGGIAGYRFGYNTNNTCTISGCYSTGSISGSNAGGLVGADVGYNDASYTPVVNITNCYSLGTIATTCGGICGGTDGSVYTNTPSITITNCFSYGTIVDANSGIVSTSYPKTTTQTNVYAAAGTWNITNANANLTGTPTNFNTPGSTWTMVDSQYPYVLSLYNAALYTSSSVSGITTYTSAGSVFGSTGYTYIIININQVANVATTKVFAYKGTAPNYYSYNYNTFTLTDTNGDSVPGKMSSSIGSTTGVLTITKSANNISADGSGNSIYLQMSGDSMQYSVGSTPGTWTTISTWPMTLTNSNSNPGPSSVLRVVATQALSISSSTGTATTGYFIAGSPYITFDGSGNTITINTVTFYVGLIQNGGTTAGSNGFANVVVQNFTTAVSGGSSVASSAGWLCQQYFGRNVLGNAITGCTNSSTGLISLTNAGGIAGSTAGSYGGSLTFTSCTNNGTISGSSAGGIAGYSAGYGSGLVTFTSCTNNGAISGTSSGGIAGQYAGYNSGLATFTGCTNTGTISGQSAGGIAGYSAGRYTGSATFTNCTNSGNVSNFYAGGIAGQYAGANYGSATFTNCTNTASINLGGTTFGGGIAGQNAADNFGLATFTGCTNTGIIYSQAGGIAAAYAGSNSGSVTFTSCTNSGALSGGFAGGIAGNSVGNTNGSATFTGCANTGAISGGEAGGIVGVNGGLTNGLVTITNCFSTGAISGQYAGGIAGGRFATNTSRNCVIRGSYSTGAISGNNAGGIAGGSVGYSTSASYTASVDISNCYSLGAIVTTSGGICGGYAGSVYTNKATIRISNCYSYGDLVDANSGVVAVSLTSTYINLTTPNTYVAGFVGGTNWTDASANASLTGTPTGIGLSIGGTTWTAIGTNNPYVLSGYNAALYNPNSANALTPYTSARGLFTDPSYNYTLVNTTQTGSTATANVFASKGTSPYYSSYNLNTFAFTNSSGSSTPLLSSITPSNGILSFSVTTYSVTYYGNTNTSGAPPTDVLSPYDANSSVTILGNTGSLVKTGYTFANWNTSADGLGTPYSPTDTFTITADTALYAQWTPTTYPCFLEGTKILCFENNEEVYRPIESLRKGDLVKTIYNGYMPIYMMGTTALYNPGNDYRVANRMYKCSREKYPALFEDLYITGCHSILVPRMTNDQWENTKAVNGNIYVTDNHFRLIACADEKAEPFNKEGFMNIYHIALDHNDICMNYGIYANGLLVESCSIEYLIKYSSLKILGQEDCSLSENVSNNIIRQLVDTY